MLASEDREIVGLTLANSKLDPDAFELFIGLKSSFNSVSIHRMPITVRP